MNSSRVGNCERDMVGQVEACAIKDINLLKNGGALLRRVVLRHALFACHFFSYSSAKVATLGNYLRVALLWGVFA